jgi:steroid 5-alpha reductase family enzyme
VSQPDWSLIALATAAATVLQVALWVVHRRLRDAGLVDLGWAASLGAMAVFHAVAAAGAPAPRALVGVAGGLWGGRLALHLLCDRILGKSEDSRYARLRAHWGARADRLFFWVFVGQGVLAGVLSVPFWLAAHDPAPALGLAHFAGLALFAIALSGEAIADRQLARFRADPRNRGRTCRVGLWRLSRHPNYFFEWLVWCAFALFAWPAPHGVWALGAPLLMLVLITKVTGIPHTEAQAALTRPDYADYQRTTNAFLPWPRLRS